MKKLFAALALLISLQVVSTSAQSLVPSPTPTPHDEKDTVVITTNLIQIDVTVTDKDGNVVTDLKPEDFEIYENDRQQKITNFSFVALQPEKPRENTPTVNNKKNGIAPPPMPSTVRPEQVRRTIAIVVDDLGLSFASAKWTKDAVRKFVDEQMQPGDLVAIIRTGSGIGALQQFTSDKRLLYAAIEKIRWNTRGRGGIGSFTPIEPNLSEQLSGVKDLTGNPRAEETEGGGNPVDNIEGMKEEREFQRDVIESQENIFAVGTLGAVGYIMRGMGQLPGRKAIMLFSDGFKLFSRKGVNSRIIDGLNRLTDQANRSGVIIYALDARGLEVPMLTASDDTYGLSSEQVDERLEERANDLFDTQQSLRYLAEQTGGFAIINQNNLSKGVNRILNDQKGYYLVGYEPDEDIFDPAKRRFNKLTVKLKRPGLKIRYRSGFFGIRDEDEKPQTPAEQLVEALTSPFAAKEIEMRLTSLFVDDGGIRPSMRSFLHIKGDDLKFIEEKDGWFKAQFEVVAMTFGDNGVVVGDIINRKQTIRAPAQSMPHILKNGFTAQVSVPLQGPGAYQMRIAIRDEQSSRVGSASQYIEVPNLKKKWLTLSGIFLGRVETHQINVSTAGNALTDLQRDAALRRFSLGNTVRFDYSVYNAKAEKGALPRLTSQFKIFSEGKEVFVSPEKAVVIGSQPDYKHIDVTGAFTVGSNLPPGDYVLQVIVKDLQAKEKRSISTQWIDFEVLK